MAAKDNFGSISRSAHVTKAVCANETKGNSVVYVTKHAREPQATGISVHSGELVRSWSLKRKPNLPNTHQVRLYVSCHISVNSFVGASTVSCWALKTSLNKGKPDNSTTFLCILRSTTDRTRFGAVMLYSDRILGTKKQQEGCRLKSARSPTGQSL